MPEFQYTAREMSGQEVTGLLTAGSQLEAASTLATRNLFPVQIGLADEAASVEQLQSKRVRPRHLAVMYSQLADLIRSGVPLLRSLELIERQTSRKTLQFVLQDVRDQVADGTRLADAMKRHRKVFSDLAVSMIHAGEEGGFLEDVLERVATFTEHSEELKARVTGAMVYPAFLLTFGGGIVTAMLVFFVPKFEPVFARMSSRGTLPWATTTLLGMSETASKYGLYLAIAFAAVVFLLVHYFKSEDGRRVFDLCRLRAFGLGPIVRSLAISRFCRILGTLLSNGVPILQSLRIAKDATSNIILSEAIETAAEHISAGKSLAAPLGASKQFPEEVVEMIAVGEEANNLEHVLINISDNMERRTYRQLEMFVRLLEPILLIFMAAIILFVVAGLLLPVFQSSNIV